MSAELQGSLDEKKLINRLIYAAAVIYPLTTIPQIIDIFSNHSAENVSLLTWLMYDFFTLIFLWFAIVNKIKPLVIEYMLWLVAQTIVVAGVIAYGM